MLGWFGGYGFHGTMGFFTQQMGIPAPLAFLAICAEFFGGLGLIVGLLSRIAAFGIIVQHACRDHDGSPLQRLLHELDRPAEGRGFRVSPAGAGAAAGECWSRARERCRSTAR